MNDHMLDTCVCGKEVYAVCLRQNVSISRIIAFKNRAVKFPQLRRFQHLYPLSWLATNHKTTLFPCLFRTSSPCWTDQRMRSFWTYHPCRDMELGILWVIKELPRVAWAGNERPGFFWVSYDHVFLFNLPFPFFQSCRLNWSLEWAGKCSRRDSAMRDYISRWRWRAVPWHKLHYSHTHWSTYIYSEMERKQGVVDSLIFYLVQSFFALTVSR